MSELVATRTTMRIRIEGRVATVCLQQPCVLCGRPFEIQNGAEEILIARDARGARLGTVCPRCALAGEEILRERMLARAERLKARAEELERWSDGEMLLPDSGEPSASRETRSFPRGAL